MMEKGGILVQWGILIINRSIFLGTEYFDEGKCIDEKWGTLIGYRVY